MQYLLTEEEYTKLKAQITAAEMCGKDKVQKLCTLVANFKPVKIHWDKDAEPKPWGCIRNEVNNPGYCDECPVDDECPYDRKRWSK